MDVAEDINSDVEETTNSNESGNEDTTDLAQENDALRKALAQNNARAKRAEDELKKLKATPAQPQIKSTHFDEELKLIARGLSDEEIDQAKVIAKGKGVNLSEAVKDPLFVMFQNNLKETERKENAKLGASRGSGETVPEITGIQSGSTREEHLNAFKKISGIK